MASHHPTIWPPRRFYLFKQPCTSELGVNNLEVSLRQGDSLLRNSNTGHQTLQGHPSSNIHEKNLLAKGSAKLLRIKQMSARQCYSWVISFFTAQVHRPSVVCSKPPSTPSRLKRSKPDINITAGRYTPVWWNHWRLTNSAAWPECLKILARLIPSLFTLGDGMSDHRSYSNAHKQICHRAMLSCICSAVRPDL